MKTAIYLRVSSSEQNPDNQISALQGVARRLDVDIVEIYQEQESAWKSGHQKELARLIEDVRSGRRKYDMLLVWALDRLSREGVAAILNLVNTFRQYGVKVLSYQEPWTEAPGPMGDILYAITGWVAQYESDRRSERTKAGLARVIKEGKKLGRPPGSKDKHKRKRTGYLLRYANKGAVNSHS